MPLYRKLPQRGFSNFRFHKGYAIVNVGDLARLGEAEGPVDRAVLVRAGLVREDDHPLKVLGDGELTRALEVHAARFSASARSKIEAAGGKVVEG